MEESVKQELKALAKGKGIPCQEAWDFATSRKMTRQAVGNAMDELEIKVLDCQLGCFGSTKATHEELKGKSIAELIRREVAASLEDGRLPCAVAHSIARKLTVTSREVGDTATLMSVKVSQCQIGCF
jgi:hypothetical protein